MYIVPGLPGYPTLSARCQSSHCWPRVLRIGNRRETRSITSQRVVGHTTAQIQIPTLHSRMKTRSFINLESAKNVRGANCVERHAVVLFDACKIEEYIISAPTDQTNQTKSPFPFQAAVVWPHCHGPFDLRARA